MDVANYGVLFRLRYGVYSVSEISNGYGYFASRNLW